jgi:hypothetical protein
MNGRQMAQNSRMKILALLVAVASVCFGQDKMSPIEINCTFQSNLDVLKTLSFPGYSYTKVAPENIVFVRPDVLPRSDRPRFQSTFWDLGKGFGRINGTVDWREVGHRLRAIASTHGANVVAYQIAGAEIRVQFLRAADNIYKALLGQKDIKPLR